MLDCVGKLWDACVTRSVVLFSVSGGCLERQRGETQRRVIHGIDAAGADGWTSSGGSGRVCAVLDGGSPGECRRRVADQATPATAVAVAGRSRRVVDARTRRRRCKRRSGRSRILSVQQPARVARDHVVSVRQRISASLLLLQMWQRRRVIRRRSWRRDRRMWCAGDVLPSAVELRRLRHRRLRLPRLELKPAAAVPRHLSTQRQILRQLRVAVGRHHMTGSGALLLHGVL